MEPRIHLVRHAQSEHNVTHDRSQHDPPLTALGEQQISELAEKFPYHDQVAVILTSPLRRTIQTALGGFSHILDRTSPRIGGASGIENGAQFEIYQQVQPTNGMPCNVGSKREILEKEFAGLDFSELSDTWMLKEGFYADTEETVAERGKAVRNHLASLVEKYKAQGGERRDIVLVGHGDTRDYVTGEGKVDWPRAGWASFHLVKVADGHRLELIS
ncbi:phosphoglycerate mutase [Microthyrium microscopicum]|uniref:Phosphoglycerate mutase n=1 Tax=Microthyrium microscopicum TaxID=703497 RepID=A0A6A6UI47_9PEZI|nr:phosphoglycerate mutase [Microthyrium microscopicum]